MRITHGRSSYFTVCYTFKRTKNITRPMSILVRYGCTNLSRIQLVKMQHKLALINNNTERENRMHSLIFTPKSLLCTPQSRAILVPTCGTARGARLGGGGGSLGWRGGVLGLIRVLNRAWILTWQPDSRLRIPSWLPFQQWTGETSSADDSWIGPRNGDCDLAVYPPPYLRKGFFPFICHESNKLWE